MAFDTYYSNHPWEGISSNQRDWYVPTLREIYLRKSQYLGFVSNQFQLAGPGSPVTQSMNITSLIPPHADFSEISLRQLWMPSSYVDTFSRQINFKRYGGKLALHKFDNLITYWKQNGKTGLKPIIDRYLGGMMMESLEQLARNSFLENTYAMYGAGGVDFSSIINHADHKMTTDLVEDINLGMEEREAPFTIQAGGEQVAGAGRVVCITTPGVIRDLRTEASASGNENAFIDVSKYQQSMRIMQGELGIYKGVRFVSSTRAILYNSGPITVQPTVTIAINAGDGAWANKVEGVRQVGQTGAVNTLTLSDTTGLAINDIVSIHTSRTANFGVTDGVDHRDGTLHYRRIVDIQGGVGGTIALDKPIMVDMNVDLGSGVYAYVTKGRHIHSSTFIGGQDGVVMGVGQSPQIYTPRPVDDFDSMYRVSWDGYLGMQLFEPEVFEVVFSAGTNRQKGAKVQ